MPDSLAESLLPQTRVATYAPDYIKDPKAIYDASFAVVRSAARLDQVPLDVAPVVTRLVHACGMPDILDDLQFSPDLVCSAIAALRAKASIFCDCEMVASGITRRFLPSGNDVIVTLNDSRTPYLAKKIGNTRSAAAVELWGDRLDGGIVAVGNAPTALFRLLEIIAVGGPKPAAILGFAVGFIGAAESKAALVNFARDTGISIPYIAIHGSRGGSAMASAAVNALAIEAAGSI